jgi:hypothetical protein
MTDMFSKCFFPTVFFCFFFSRIFAQIEPAPMGARSLGMANAHVTLQDGWALYNNVAGIASLKNVEVFGGYENRFNVSEFQTFGLGLVAPMFKGVAGVSVSRFGDNLYSEQKIGLGYAYQVGGVSMGVKANFLQVSIDGLPSQNTFVFEFGGIAQITKELFFGGYIYNLSVARFKTQFEEDQLVPVVLKAGLSYRPFETIIINVEAEKDVDYAVTYKAGIEYQIIPHVYLRTGFKNPFKGKANLVESFTTHFGAGFFFKNIRFDYALYSSENRLGLTHHLSMGFEFKKKS